MSRGKISFSKKRVNTYQEELMLAGMIMNERFLREVRAVYRSDLVKSRYIKTIASWCLDYYNRYETNPGPAVESFYHSALKDGMDDAEAEAVSKFIEKMNGRAQNGEYENFNVDHALDEVEDYFGIASAEFVRDRIDSYLKDGDRKGAEQAITEYKTVQRPSTDHIDPFIDENIIRGAFEETTEPLYKFPGAEGELVNEYLVRGGFVGLMGAEKMGKTWLLIEHAMRASSSMLNVAFFGAGDMTAKQMARRKAIYIAMRSNSGRYCGRILVPVLDCVKNQTNTCRLPRRECRCGLLGDDGNPPEPGEEPAGYIPCSKCIDKPHFQGAFWYRIREPVEPLTYPEARKYNRWWHDVRMKGKEFRLSCHANTTLNVADIDNYLNLWCYLDEWTPDVVIIDYADILKAEPGCDGYSERDKQNETWKALRRLGQEWHCLVIAATQADAASYDQGLLLRRNFSEDKRKYGHSTVTIGLNQTPEEKAKRLMRHNIIMAREGDYNPYKTTTILQCLEMGRPHLDSFWTPRQEEN